MRPYSLSRRESRPYLSHHLTPVCLYRDLADVELATDLFIQQTGGYHGHNLPFARRERLVTVPERPCLCFTTKCCGLAALDGVSDGTQQHIVTEWLRQVTGAPVAELIRRAIDAYLEQRKAEIRKT